MARGAPNAHQPPHCTPQLMSSTDRQQATPARPTGCRAAHGANTITELLLVVVILAVSVGSWICWSSSWDVFSMKRLLCGDLSWLSEGLDDLKLNRICPLRSWTMYSVCSYMRGRRYRFTFWARRINRLKRHWSSMYSRILNACRWPLKTWTPAAWRRASVGSALEAAPPTGVYGIDPQLPYRPTSHRAGGARTPSIC